MSKRRDLYFIESTNADGQTTDKRRSFHEYGTPLPAFVKKSLKGALTNIYRFLLIDSHSSAIKDELDFDKIVDYDGCQERLSLRDHCYQFFQILLSVYELSEN